MLRTDSSGRLRAAPAVRGLAGRLVAAACLLALTLPAGAWEHAGSKVAFVEYREGLVEELREQGRPYFLLFSAEWCHWCHEFGENTLTDDEVAEYLNANFVSIFIDADIHSSAYQKYRATGLPYTVFLNPDATPHFRYAGTLYAEDFLTVIEQVKSNVDQGLSVESDDSGALAYEPPGELAREQIERFPEMFRRGLLDNFDPEEDGLGRGQKALYPSTFLYLLASAEPETREAAARSLEKTLLRAIARIYDPLEGGFFRYAETRDWQIPHYEKMADLNAGATLLLLRVNAARPDPALAAAADRTLDYLRGRLYDPDLGVFLSFQEADTRYYAMRSADARAKADAPGVSRSVYIDRLALTVTYLLDVLDYRPDPALQAQLVSSLDFVARELEAGGTLSRYYVIERGTWAGVATLQDHALVARMFLHASERLKAPRYRSLARRAAHEAVARFLDRGVGVLADPTIGDTGDAEFLMEVNGLIAQTLMALEDDDANRALVSAIIAYFSEMGEVYEERLWEGKNWAFTERYVAYLRAADRYLERSKLSARSPP